jgi:hypothetical protein
MSALGQKQTLHHVRPMSALPPKADIAEKQLDVRFVPEADILRFGKYSITSSAVASSFSIRPRDDMVLARRIRSILRNLRRRASPP